MMRCVALSTAETYALQDFARALKNFEFINFIRMLCMPLMKSGSFVFKYGCVVFWNVPPEKEIEFKNLLETVSRGVISPVREEFDYSFSAKPRFFQDKITLSNTRSHALQQLSVSYGLSQTLKLTAFEERIDATIAMTKNIPEELARRGKISLSRKEISQRIGKLFVERTSVNLHSDILDAPVFIWDHPEYEKLYTMTINDLELHSRTAVLNRRLDVVKELFEMMRDELNTRHSTMLELTIVVLIMLEVFLTLVSEVFHLV